MDKAGTWMKPVLLKRFIVTRFFPPQSEPRIVNKEDYYEFDPFQLSIE